MARRKDPEIQENVDRGEENELGSGSGDEGSNNYNGDGTNVSDTIKNANATGLGSIGRNDHRQTGHAFNDSADAGNE